MAKIDHAAIRTSSYEDAQKFFEDVFDMHMWREIGEKPERKCWFREGMFSTVDICAVDLYTGICNFLKAGASSTFIKRDHWVESIASESLAAGLIQQLDFDTASRKLYHGDYLIMMTDGVLDALPAEHEEETMKEIIMDVHEDSPKDFGRGILERVLGYSDYRARDDMTVLVAGVWKK